MSVRKLNQDKADALGTAYVEYDGTKQPIVRLDADGNEVILRNHAAIAEWGGISEGRYYELKKAKWQLKRGTGRPPAPEPPSVSEATFAQLIAQLAALTVLVEHIHRHHLHHDS